MTNIERAQPKDFLAVAALDRMAWKQNQHSEFIPDGEHVWRVWCQYALVYVAKKEEKVAAAVLAFPCSDGSYCLHKVMVDESCRGEGIGSKLFEVLLAEIDRLKVDVFLTVDPINENAIKLYTKWGFTERTLVPGFYREYENRFVLIRKFKKEKI
jgi:[ribosomal protein S18]-alanine N-acetyltransferase